MSEFEEYIIPLGLPEAYSAADWQQQDIDYLTERQYSANWSEMGCIRGTASIRVLTASGKVKDWKIEDAFLGFNHLNVDSRKNWKSPDHYKVLSLVDGRIRHNELEGISYSGIKECIKLTLEDGRFIELTPDHEVLIYPDIWIEAQQVSVGDELRVIGGKGKKHNASRERYKWIGNERRHRIRALTPVGMHTHHIDESKRNDEPENLDILTLEEHSRLHAPDQIASYDAPPMKVVKIEDIGAHHTYDLSMAAPNHNFVTNGIVVHNCRKTTTGLWTIDHKVKALGEGIVPIILIVTTRSGKGTYFDAIPKCLEGYRVFDVGSNDADELEFLGDDVLRFNLDPVHFWDATREKNLKQPAIILAHYHVFMNKCKMLPFLRKLGYAFILIDEAHRIKEKDNQWTRNLKALTCWTGYKHVMTGTGFINRPHELWSLLNFLDPKVFSSFKAFRELFCDEFKTPSGFTIIRGVKPEMLDEFRDMRKKLGPRRLLRETNPDINLPVFTPLHVELNATQRRMYTEIVQQLRAMDQAGMPLYTPNVLSMLSRCRQICVATPRVVEDYFDEKENRRIQKIILEEPSSKLDMLMEFLDSLEWDDESKNQVVVFSCFEDPLKLLQQRLEKADIPYLWMKASHNDAERYEMWHNTWPKKEHRVFMSTLQLGSESINLSAAKYCVFLDRSWSPKDNNQGVSRIYRPGQTDTAQIIHINAVRTTDQRIERVNEVKEGWFREVFGEGEEPFKTIEDEFQELLNPKSEDDELVELIDKAFDSEKRGKLEPELENVINEIEAEVNPGWEEALREKGAEEVISDIEILEATELLSGLHKDGNKSNVQIVEDNGIRKLIL